MGEAPERIRAEIEQTRAEMGETVDAIGYKADVPARAKESIQHKRDAAKEGIVGAAQGVRDKLVGARDTVGDAAPDREQVRQTSRQAVGMAKENPLGLAI